MISTVYADLYSVIADAGLRYFETTSTFVTDGTATYTEPTNHYATVGLDYVDAGGVRTALVEIMTPERNMFSGITGGIARMYSLIDNKLTLYPTPTTGQTYIMTYIPQAPLLAATADGTAIDVVTADGENYLAWGVTVLALAKEESDASLARAERDMCRERIMGWANERSFATKRRSMVDNDWDALRDPGDWWPRGG